MYAVSQKKTKKAKKEQNEETAALYSKPDREGRKAKSVTLISASIGNPLLLGLGIITCGPGIH